MVRHFISPLQNIHREAEQFWKNRGHTRMANQRSRAEKQEIDRLLFALDVPADIIHGVDQAGVCLDEDVLPLRVQRLAFGCNTISGFLRAADKNRRGVSGYAWRIASASFHRCHWWRRRRRRREPEEEQRQCGNSKIGRQGGRPLRGVNRA